MPPTILLNEVKQNMEKIGNTYLIAENGTLSITTSRWDAMFRELINRS